mmetsp:Transcript_4597/g.13405  ORF Transcript_4597/g.13405 Transcript_4597/m.13405 type:complete len:284 (-) Transcript_4597:337-1188(-)
MNNDCCQCTVGQVRSASRNPLQDFRRGAPPGLAVEGASRSLALLLAADPLPLEANLEIARVLYYSLELLRDELQLFEELLWRGVLPEFDRLDQGLREFLAHHVHRIHLEVGVAQRDQVRDDLRVELPLHLKERLDLPLAHLAGELRLELGAGRDDSDLLEHRQQLRHPFGRAVLDPPIHCVGDDECVAQPQSQLQEAAPGALDLAQVPLHDGGQDLVLAQIQERCAQHRVIPIEDDHGLVPPGPLRLRHPGAGVRELAQELHPELLLPPQHGGVSLEALRRCD